jgi:hypothetical protein
MPLHMFVRFRETPSRLQVSIVETRRLDGRVRHEHIASLGSIETPLSVSGRIVFWQQVNERLGRLSNRVVAAAQGKIRGDIHARIPMVTLDERGYPAREERGRTDRRGIRKVCVS